MTAPSPAPVREILLQNPVKEHFATFVFGNACHCEQVVTQDTAVGQHIVICGAGPSLRDTAAKWIPGADQVWGCNSALTWLADHGYQPTHGFTVDQTPQMLAEWQSVPDVEYLLASSVHPHLTELLLKAGRRIRWFHNYCGIEGRNVSYNACRSCDAMFDRAPEITACPTCGSADIVGETTSYEDWLYAALYPSTVTVGSGLNAVTRAIDIAAFMGAAKITVLGADCALRTRGRMPAALPMGSPQHLAWLRENTEMHADGGNALASDASCLTLEAIIDSGTPDETVRPGHGRHWMTKPDLVITAVWLVWMKIRYGSRLRIMGDTLPKAILNKSEAYLRKLPTMTDATGQPIEFVMPSHAQRQAGAA